MERWSLARDSHDLASTETESAPSRTEINHDTETFDAWFIHELAKNKQFLPGIYITQLGFLLEITLNQDGEFMVVQFIDLANWKVI